MEQEEQVHGDEGPAQHMHHATSVEIRNKKDGADGVAARVRPDTTGHSYYAVVGSSG